jgi:NAD(P)-dependent dehydrogenase (short-subunit alcohol dehydrogenase family)
MPERVIVTGAGRGLGLALARALSARGHLVAGTVRDPAGADALAVLPGVTVEQLDLADGDALPGKVASIADRLGGVDVVINNAAINAMSVGGGRATLSVRTMETAPMLELFRVDVVAPLLVVRGALDHLVRSPRGRVINVTSWLGSIGGYATDSAVNYGYRSAKAALNMATRALAAELEPEGVTAVVVNPGWMRTDMGGGDKADLDPDHVAEGIVELAGGLTMADTGRFLDWDGADRPY